MNRLIWCARWDRCGLYRSSYAHAHLASWIKMASNCSLPFVYISGEEVRRLVGMAELIEEMARGLRWVSERDEGGVVQPVRTVVRVDKYCGSVRAMT